MQKLYNIVKVMLIFVLLFTQNKLQAQKCCVECQADVKVVSDKQVLLEKIDLKVGTLTTNINTNLYVSYRSGNSQKFWTNLVVATAGIAVSTQLNKANLSEGKSANGVSPLLPLGVSVATLPSIWKNRPRGIPQAGLYIQHRDTRGKLLESWEQPISIEAKNDAELLTVSIDKPLTAGTLEIYLQNGSKNGVYYWGYGTTSKSVKPIPQSPTVSSSMAGCPEGYLPNGNGMCCSPFTGDCVGEGGGTPPVENPSPTNSLPVTNSFLSCPVGYLPNGQGMCNNPFTGQSMGEVTYSLPQPGEPIVGCGCDYGVKYRYKLAGDTNWRCACRPPVDGPEPLGPGDPGPPSGGGGGGSNGGGSNGGGSNNGGGGSNGGGAWYPVGGNGGNGGTQLPPAVPVNPTPVIDEGNAFFELSISDQIEYPKFTELVKDLYRYIQRDRKVMEALILWSGYSEQQIKEKVKFKEGPMIVIKELNGAIGSFNHNISPDVINIDISWVRGLEQAYLTSTKQATAFLLAVTILHELVHQGRYANDLDRNTWEYGWGFEQSAFGMIIDRNNAGKYSYRLFKK